jgi:hypothetical protein
MLKSRDSRDPEKCPSQRDGNEKQVPLLRKRKIKAKGRNREPCLEDWSKMSSGQASKEQLQ